ncbi:MAG: H(+)/Cl(-) exchange transporter ClcA [Armatimonadota bacterium]
MAVEGQQLNSKPDEDKLSARKLRSWSMLRGRRQHHFMRAALVGLFAGIAAVLFQIALFYAEGLRNHFISWLKMFPTWGWVVLPVTGAVVGAVAGYITSKYAPEASGSGIPHVKAVLLQLRPIRWQRILPVKFIGGILAIGAGFSLGREGPTVQMGASVGKMLSQFLHVPKRSRPQLVAAGAGAGLAAAFNAPLAGFIFVIEELQREMSPLTYSTALIAAVAGDIVTRTLTGQLPSFRIAGYPTPPLAALPFFVALGLLSGVMGALFNRGLLRSLKFSHGLTRLPAWARPAIVGVIVGLLAWWLPCALGGGHSTAELVLRGKSYTMLTGHITFLRLIGFLALLLAVKFVLTIISYASGVPGGIFAPLLMMGALLGAIVGRVSGIWWPEMAHTPAAFAVIGMAAAFSAIVRAPLTGIVLILEMTGNYQQLLPLIVASLIAYLMGDYLHNKPIYESLLEYDLERGGKRSAGSSEPILIDTVVEPRSVMDGKMVRDLNLPAGCLLVTINRAGKEIVPGADTKLCPGDRLTAIVSGDNPEACATVKAMGVELQRNMSRD